MDMSVANGRWCSLRHRECASLKEYLPIMELEGIPLRSCRRYPKISLVSKGLEDNEKTLERFFGGAFIGLHHCLQWQFREYKRV